MTTYVTGYNGTVRNRAELLAWSQFQMLDAEMGRRVLAVLDASAAAGCPLGIGSIFRSDADADTLFLSRHHKVTIGGCCTFRKDGKRYKLNSGQAHAAQGGSTMHGPTTRLGKALAIDWLGDSRAFAWLKANCKRFGLNEFSNVNNEPWHSQPAELPLAKSRYQVATMDPLRVITLPGQTAPAPTRVLAPTPTLMQRVGLFAGKNDVAQVRALQYQCNFWGWRDVNGKKLLVDGDYGSKTTQAVIAMQRVLRQTADGQYGPMSARALQQHLDAMVALAVGA